VGKCLFGVEWDAGPHGREAFEQTSPWWRVGRWPSQTKGFLANVISLVESGTLAFADKGLLAPSDVGPHGRGAGENMSPWWRVGC
jgi:hypothetical protein